jgi:hypothetical protein
VWRVDRRTGSQFAGSRQSHTTPRAQGWSWSCPITRVGTTGGRYPVRRACAAASASVNHERTSRSYTPGRNSDSMCTGPRGRGANTGGASLGQQPTSAQADAARGRGRRRSTLHEAFGVSETTGEESSPGNASRRRSELGAATMWSGCENLSAVRRAASHAAWPTGPSRGPSATRPSSMAGRDEGAAGASGGECWARRARAARTIARARCSLSPCG